MRHVVLSFVALTFIAVGCSNGTSGGSADPNADGGAGTGPFGANADSGGPAKKPDAGSGGGSSTGGSSTGGSSTGGSSTGGSSTGGSDTGAAPGEPCTDDSECMGEENATCVPDPDFPGGYCIILSCDQNTCPAGSECYDVGNNTTACLKTCNANSDCRAEYICDSQGKACVPACKADADCGAGNHCTVATGECAAGDAGP